jgi:hypothetical protein
MTPEQRLEGARASRRLWYRENAERAKSHVKDRIRELLAWAHAYKEAQACAVCGEGDPVCLEFHHRNPAEKQEDVARAVRAGWSLQRLESEVAKCVVLCANCHRKLHAGRLELPKSRRGADSLDESVRARDAVGSPGG